MVYLDAKNDWFRNQTAVARQAEHSTKRSLESDFWIDCDNCHKWFHGKCCGLTKVECNKICPFTATTLEAEKYTTEPLKRKLLQNSSPANLRQTPRRSLKAQEAALKNIMFFRNIFSPSFKYHLKISEISCKDLWKILNNRNLKIPKEVRVWDSLNHL